MSEENHGKSSYVTAKVTEALLESYRISREELYWKVMESLRKDKWGK